MKQVIGWKSVEEHFEVSSGINLDIRDIIVRDCSLAEWDLLLQWLEKQDLETFWTLDSEPATPSFASAEDVFEERLKRTVALYINIESVLIRAFFFHPSEIELDFHASEIDCQESLDTLVWFVSELGRLFSRQVVVSYSEVADGQDWILKYHPDSRSFEVRTDRVPFDSPRP